MKAQAQATHAFAPFQQALSQAVAELLWAKCTHRAKAGAPASLVQRGMSLEGVWERRLGS